MASITIENIKIAESPSFLEYENKVFISMDSIFHKYFKKNEVIEETELGKIYYYDIVIPDGNTYKSAAYSYKETTNTSLQFQITFIGENFKIEKTRIIRRISTWFYQKRSMIAAGTGFLSGFFLF
jgi:hypothetical protein